MRMQTQMPTSKQYGPPIWNIIVAISCMKIIIHITFCLTTEVKLITISLDLVGWRKIQNKHFQLYKNILSNMENYV